MSKNTAHDNFSCSLVIMHQIPHVVFFYIGVCLRCMGKGGAEEYNSRFVLDLSKPNSLPSISQGMKERTSPVTKHTQCHSTCWE